jgi:hypothetical protein
MNDTDLHRHHNEVIELLRGIRQDAGTLILRFNELLTFLRQTPRLTKARIILMPKSVTVGGTANAAIVGLDQNGKPFTLDSTFTVAYASSNPADESFSPVNPDGSDTVAALAASPAGGDQISATITRPDGVVISATPDVLTITPVVPVLTSASVVLS